MRIFIDQYKNENIYCFTMKMRIIIDPYEDDEDDEDDNIY